MAQQAPWETFSDGSTDDDDDDDDETLSLCDLPVRNLEKQEGDDKSSAALEDFEFRTLGNGLLLKPGPEKEMCAADDIFYRGQLLPLRSCGGSRSGRSLSSSNSNSISSSNCSSTSISRSQSSSSQNSSILDGPRLSISNKFYAHPSPRPQVRTSFGSGRKSTGSAPPGWAVFRLGVAKAPEIELSDLKLRRLRSSEGKCEAKVTKSLSRFRFGCKCTSDVSEPLPMSPARPLIPKKKREKEMVVGFDRRESNCKSSRMCEWLQELSLGKGSAYIV